MYFNLYSVILDSSQHANTQENGDCYEHTHVHHDFMHAYHVTCDLQPLHRLCLTTSTPSSTSTTSTKLTSLTTSTTVPREHAVLSLKISGMLSHSPSFIVIDWSMGCHMSVLI
jgi:hypothetical protein